MKTSSRSYVSIAAVSCAFLLAFGPDRLHGQTPSTAQPPAANPQAENPPPGSPNNPIVLSPFEVDTSKDNGYAATNEISGSRVDTPIKDIPIPIDVITSEFISDTGATDLRSSLNYMSGIMLQTQNDLENSGGTYGSAYGPGGVNNPQGLTSNPDDVQLKIRGFVTTNTLRDGFLRESSSDSVNIDRIEVVFGPNALLYGTGNFGGVVDYLTKMPLDQQQGSMTLSYGTYDFERSALDVTGPVSAASHLDYRLAAAWESTDSNIEYQSESHFLIAPTLTWKPTPSTTVLVDTEYSESKQNGIGFQALRAVEGGGATPINNDQIEATAFYFPPGADPRTFNLSGPDTYDDQQESNIELKLTQQLLKETEYLPEVNFLVGYDHSNVAVQLQDINGQINGPIALGAPGSDLAETIFTTQSNDSIGGQGSNNLNLVYGALPAAVVEYAWNQNHMDTSRDQERVEFTGHKSQFANTWYSVDDQVLAGYSELRNNITQSNWETNTASSYDYASPTSLAPLRFGTQGDNTPDVPMYENDLNNINTGWDAGYYLNNYAKLFDSRIILMNGLRHDKNDNWSTDEQVSGPGAAGVVTTDRAGTVVAKSYQNGVMVELTKNFSIYGLRSEGIDPNFGGLHNAATGTPVSDDYAKSEEYGVKFAFLDGKISGRISHYKITKTEWAAEPWYAPAPMGNPRFNPNKPIVYELSGGGGGFNANGVPGSITNYPGITSAGSPIQTEPQVVAAWNAAATAGAIYTLPNEPGRLYLNASTPTGAAYLNTAFAANQADGGAGWPGWLYQGDSNQDPNINNATEDAAGFYNTSQNPAFQIVDQSKGWDGELDFTPNQHLQFVFNASIDSTVERLNLGTWPKYPYPQDIWAVWYFQNGGFGLNGEPLNVAYTNPQDTSTRTNAGVYPGDDTPKYAADLFANYKVGDALGGTLKGLTVGAGGQWHSQEEFFSGVTHGGQNIEQNAAGQTIVAYSNSELTLSLFAKYEWKSWGHAQSIQLNVDNLLDDQQLYGLIYNAPLTAKLTYGVSF